MPTGHFEGRLLRNLEEKLADCGVRFSPIPREDIFTALERQGRIDPFTRLVATFLQHFKDSRLSFSDLAGRAGRWSDQARAQAFLAVFRPIFERYQDKLTRSGKIDFHDMIGRATDLSDIAVMREFGDRFGPFERSGLVTTFRCADRIASVATDFVLRNPGQIRKKVRTTRKTARPAVFIGLPGEQEFALLKEALDRVAEDARRHGGMSAVLLLGRYRHRRPRNLGSLVKVCYEFLVVIAAKNQIQCRPGWL